MTILLANTWSNQPTTTETIPQYLVLFVSALLRASQSSQAHRLRLLLRRKEDIYALQAAIPALTTSDAWEVAWVERLDNVQVIGKALKDVHVVLWVDDERERHFVRDGKMLLKAISSTEVQHFVYRGQVQSALGRTNMEEAKHILEVEHQKLEFACTIIESNPLFISPVNKNSPVEQIVYTLSSRSSTSTFSSLQELANAEANLVMFSRHVGFRTYEITSRHHSDEGIGNVYFHQPSKRRSVSVKPGSVGLNRGIRRSQSRGPETQSSSAISTSSRTRIATMQPKDDVLHEAWLTFYPGTTRHGHAPRLNLLCCLPCASRAYHPTGETDDIIQRSSSPLTSPESAVTKVGSPVPKVSAYDRMSTEKFASTDNIDNIADVTHTRGRMRSTSDSTGLSPPSSPRRPEALTNVSFLRARPWKLELQEEQEETGFAV